MYSLIYTLLIIVFLIIIVMILKKKISPSWVPILNTLLLALALYLGYKIYDSITAPVTFNKIKKERYAKVIERLKDIRDSEIAMRSILGDYTASFDSLIQFVDTAKFAITQQRDSVYKEFNKFLNIWEEKETVVIDTLGFVSVKDSLFKGSNRYKEMMWVPIPGREHQVKFKLEKGYVKKGEIKMPVFKASVQKKDILYDQPEDLVAQELQVVSTEEINGPEIFVGSLDDVSTSGNWPKLYDIKDKRK